jgi:GNAT superfamily N-acetyltransferase
MPPEYSIHELDPASTSEIELVASRMRDTLIEVLGEERGGGMYTMDWLIKRVEWHLDPKICTGEVFLATESAGHVVGHTIVRLDTDFDGRPIGLFSTTYVEPSRRRRGVARVLVARGEAWMREQGMTKAVTYTDPGNTGLIELFSSAGFVVTEIRGEFAVVVKELV